MRPTFSLANLQVARYQKGWYVIPENANYQTNYFQATPGALHKIQHATGSVKFGAYLYQELGNEECTAVQNVGMCLHELSSVSSM